MPNNPVWNKAYMSGAFFSKEQELWIAEYLTHRHPEFFEKYKTAPLMWRDSCNIIRWPYIRNNKALWDRFT
jgi:hypothetical protein